MFTFLVGKPYWTGAHKAVKHIYWWMKVPIQNCLSLTGCLPKLSSIEIGLLWLLPIRVGANHLRFTIKFVGLESQPQQKVEHYGILQIFVEREREREREKKKYHRSQNDCIEGLDLSKSNNHATNSEFWSTESLFEYCAMFDPQSAGIEGQWRFAKNWNQESRGVEKQ